MNDNEMLKFQDKIGDALRVFAGIEQALGHVGEESTDYMMGTVKNLAHFSDSLISPPSGAATPPAESRPDSASSPTRSRPRT